MIASDRQRLTIACAAAMLLAFPLSSLMPDLFLLASVGLASLYYLWFARASIWLLAVVALSVTALWFIGSLGNLVFFAMGILLPGMNLAISRRMGWGLSTALLVACIAPFVGVALFHETFSGLMTAFADQLRAMAANSQVAQFYPPQEYQRVIEYFNQMADNVSYYLPGMLLSFIVIVYSLGAIVGEVLVMNAGIFTYRIPSFTHWKLDEWMVLPVGVAAICVIVDVPWLNTVGWNALLFLFFVFSVFGISFLEYQMRTRQFPLMVKIMIYVFLFLTQVVAAVALPLIALFDAKFDFRKIRAKQLG